jgi:hypothetical protein
MLIIPEGILDLKQRSNLDLFNPECPFNLIERRIDNT